MSKDEVAAALDEIGTLLELKGENPFRANAYHAASRTIQQLVGDLKQIVAEGRLSRLSAASARRFRTRSPRW